MKISKLTIAALLTMGLVVTGCNNKKSSSSSEAPSSSQEQKVVTRIAVQRVDSLVVGAELDLDQLVDVVYSDGSKDKNYTIVVAEASASLVTVEGKKVTFIKEGNPSLTLKAGERSSVFEPIVISQLKKDAMEAYASVTNDFVVGLSEDEGANFRLRKYHRPYYTYIPRYNPDGGLTNGSGFMKFATGRGYQFAISSGTITVGDQVNYDNYFTNMDLDLMLSETVTLQDDTDGDYLHLSSSVPSAWAEYGYYSHVHFLAYTLTGLSFSDPYYDANDNYLNPAAGTQYYRWESMDVYQEEVESEKVFFFDFTVATYVVAEHEAPTSTYQYEGENDQMVEDSESYGMTLTITPLSESQPGFAALETFIANPENEPVTKDFTKLKTLAEQGLDGTPHNYTVSAVSVFENATGGFNHDVFQEVYSVNEDVYDVNVAVTDHGEDVFGLASRARAQGYAIKDGFLHTYDRADNSAVKTSKTSIYGDEDVKPNTFASLSAAGVWTDLFVSTIAFDEENHVEAYSINPSRSVNFIKSVLSLTDAGYYYLNLATSIANAGYWYTSLDEAIGYGGYARFLLQYDNTNTQVIAAQFQYEAFLCYYGDTGQTWFDSTITFSSFGSTAAVDLSEIIWPAA